MTFQQKPNIQRSVANKHISPSVSIHIRHNTISTLSLFQKVIQSLYCILKSINEFIHFWGATTIELFWLR